jgi:hypothetical protein
MTAAAHEQLTSPAELSFCDGAVQLAIELQAIEPEGVSDQELGIQSRLFDALALQELTRHTQHLARL